MTFPVPVTLNLFAALLTVFRFTDISPNLKNCPSPSLSGHPAAIA